MPRQEEKWRPAGKPYPMPPMKTFPNGEVWIEGAKANGIQLVPAAVGMTSQDWKGRPACIYDGWCHLGCPTGALANPMVTYLQDARKAKAEVRPLSTVTRVLTNQAGTRVTGVEYYDDKRQKQVQEASVVILAAWSAQNPRILLNSATDKHPKGLANKNDLVGKFMMTHSHRRHLGAVRRGHHAAHGHDRRAVHVLRPLRQDELSERVRQHVHRGGRGDEDQRLCQRPRRSVRSGAGEPS